jgi:hypothetical protein
MSKFTKLISHRRTEMSHTQTSVTKNIGIIALLSTAVLLIGAIIAQSSAVAQTLVVAGGVPRIFVDTKLCDGVATMCSDSGSVGAATNGNTSIVAIYYQGTTAGLTAANFTLSAITNRGLGVTPAFVGTATCASCFAEVQPGVYRLAARPTASNWGGGTYVVYLTVTRPVGGSVSVMVPIDIPF